MKLLLDTHILLWALSDASHLSVKARKLLEDESNEIYYSIASIWEIEMKYVAHPDRMDFDAKQVSEYCSQSGYYRLPVREEHIFYLRNLKRPDTAPSHKDPFDKIMICQAMVENMLFVTHDHLLSDYHEPCIYVV